jgi:hypothetical protein
MRPLPRAALDIARRQHGLITASDLRPLGFTGRARSDALAAGALVPLHRGVYRLGSHAESFEQRSKAALLAAPDAVLAGPTAGRYWKLRAVWTEDVHILARRAIKLDLVHTHRTDLLRETDVVEKYGVRLLAPARLLCDLARFLDEAELESVFEQMLDRRLLVVESARSMARRFCRPGRPGSQEIARLLDGRPEWLKPQGPISNSGCGRRWSRQVTCSNGRSRSRSTMGGRCGSTLQCASIGWRSRSTTPAITADDLMCKVTSGAIGSSYRRAGPWYA